MKYLRFYLLLILALSPALEAQESNFRIMFLSEHEESLSLYTMLPDGTGIELLIDSAFEEDGDISYASLSPDGRTLAFSVIKEWQVDTYPSNNIFLLDMATGDISQLTNDIANNTLAKWSPDSQYLAYLSDGTWDLFATVNIVHVATQNLRVLLRSTELASVVFEDLGAVIRDLDWSPDGSQLILGAHVGLPDVRNMLVLINADGSNAQQITENEFHIGYQLVWRFDSNLIYARCTINEITEICKVHLQTLEIEQISDTSTLEASPGNPEITRFDINSESELIFADGAFEPHIYYLNLADEWSPTSVAEIEHYRHFIGWIELPE